MKRISLFFIHSLLFFAFRERVESKDLDTGEILFRKNCSVCHIDGNNIIIPEKNLRYDTLQANGMDNLESVVYQVTNGKNGMPAFGGRLQEIEIEKIGIYVLSNTWNVERSSY
jgi:cytochrome c6